MSSENPYVSYISRKGFNLYLVFSTWLYVAAANNISQGSPSATYCGRAVSIDSDMPPSQALTEPGLDPIRCVENSHHFVTEDGVSYSECMANSVELLQNQSLPLFGVEIGNVTIVVMAFLEPGHVRGVCLRTNSTDASGMPVGATIEHEPEIVCFHPFEPAAKFLDQSCSSMGCINHFFLAALGSCNMPEGIGPAEVSWAVAGFPTSNISELSEASRNSPPKNEGGHFTILLEYCWITVSY